jgi:Fe-S cluster biogenesis protein NfuA
MGAPFSTIGLDERELAAALQQLRVLVNADGADFELSEVDDGVVHIRLDLDGAACADCVLPAEELEQMIDAALQRSVPGVRTVHVIDSRRQRRL